MGFYKSRISDCHIHLFDRTKVDECLGMVEEMGYENWTFLGLVSAPRPSAVTQNLMGALLKLKSNGRCQAFGSYHYDNGLPSSDDFLEQITLYDKLGFDGIKMLDGKPGFRKRVGEPLDHPNYDAMFDYATKRQFPILYHINDPYEFWHEELLPEWAKGKGMMYDETFPKKLEIDEETFGFLRKHPHMNLCIPHFFFISDQHGLCCEMLDRYPNLYFDITPGWEMFENFAKDLDLWKKFFKKYSHKIMFGTDTFSDHWRDTVTCMRRVLETDDEFIAFEENCKGMALEDEVLDDIYFKNYYKFISLGKKMDVQGVLDYANTLYKKVEDKEDFKQLSEDIDWFKAEIKKFL